MAFTGGGVNPALIAALQRQQAPQLGQQVQQPAPITTGPTRSQLVQQLLAQQAQGRPQNIGSLGEGFARLGAELVSTATGKRAIDERLAEQKTRDQALADALAKSGLPEGIAEIAQQNPQFAVSLLGQQQQSRRAEAGAEASDAAVFNIPVSAEEGKQRGFAPGTVAAKNKRGEVKIIQSPRRDAELVKVQVGGKAGEEALAKGAATQITGIRQAAQDARRALINTGQIEERLNSLVGGTLEPGALASVKTDMLAFAEDIGFDTGRLNEIAAAQDFEALGNQFTLAATQQLKGAISNKELDFVNRTVTALGKTPNANRFVIKRLKDASISDIIRNDLVDEVRGSGSTQPLDVQISGVTGRLNALPTISKVLKDENGLPIFFTEFYQSARRLNPDASVEDIARAFRQGEKEARGRR